jgi:hypothetical protein
VTSELLYSYLLDIGWFFLITLAVIVSAAGVILMIEDFKPAAVLSPGTRK